MMNLGHPFQYIKIVELDCCQIHIYVYVPFWWEEPMEGASSLYSPSMVFELTSLIHCSTNLALCQAPYITRPYPLCIK
jgi:hypothetical protein